MKKQSILFMAVIVLISLIGTGAIMAQPKQDDFAVLSPLILKEKEFTNRSKNHTFNSYKPTADDFGNVKSPFNLPFWGEGIKLTHRTNGFLELALADNSKQRVYVDNIAYLFQTQQQATQALEQQIEMLKPQAYSEGHNRVASKLKEVKFGDIVGKVIHLDYQEDGFDYVVYYFFGVSANRVVFLMADGARGPHVEETLTSLIGSLAGVKIEPTATSLPPTASPTATSLPSSAAVPAIQQIYLPLIVK